jgi:CRISPR-associated exonuclease Cas4
MSEIGERGLTGQHYHYYSICETKLWYHHHRILYADDNEHVKMGELLDQETFKRKNKKRVGDSQMDFINKDGEIEISEVKRSSSYMDADRLQLLHYMYLLDVDSEYETDSRDVTGVIRYPEEREKKRIEWDENNKDEYKKVTKEIIDIIEGDCPPPEWKNACKKCSMREFCFA